MASSDLNIHLTEIDLTVYRLVDFVVILACAICMDAFSRAMESTRYNKWCSPERSEIMLAGKGGEI